MRITGGTLKGRVITVPSGVIRPAMDRMRESVFACLGDITGLSFLDIFSGSGIIALEAASRGASIIVAVELDKLKRKTLLENISISPVRINCRFMPAELYIKRARPLSLVQPNAENAVRKKMSPPFDIIFLDPPFPYQFKWELIANITNSSLVKNNTKILIHRPKEDYQKEDIPNLTKTDSREYGRSVVDFYNVGFKV